MKISEIILRLEEIQRNKGDIEMPVLTNTGDLCDITDIVAVHPVDEFIFAFKAWERH